MTKTINGGRIDPVHSEFQGTMDGGDRVVIRLRAPAKFPLPSNGPSSEAKWGDLQVAVTKGACLHGDDYVGCEKGTYRTEK
jgi:hypothetical protein